MRALALMLWFAVAALCAGSMTSWADAPTARCDALLAAKVPDTRIAQVTSIAAPWTAPPQGRGREVSVHVPFCRVEGVIEETIGFELWLPEKDRWNGRFLGAGVGGDAGVFNYVDAAARIAQGYAVASTDSGHKSTDARWMMDRRALENYTHRATHLMTVSAKALTERHYGKAANRNYFIGCSGGGRQGLKEMQRYATDYDGIVVGAPGTDMPRLSVRHLWSGLYQERHPTGQLTDEDWALVGRTVTRQCDAQDGALDRVVANPRACAFSVEALRCKSDAQDCLPEEKLETLRTLYSPLRDESGRVMDDGLLPGVRTRPGPPSPLLLPLFAQGVHKDPNWNPASLDLTRDLQGIYREMPEMRADDPRVAAFRDKGGKVLIYQGWLDPSVLAPQAIAYYEKLSAELGGRDRVQDFARLFLVPGMLHCRGGDATDEFGGSGQPNSSMDPEHDILSAMVSWVEHGKAPDRVIAAKRQDGRLVRTRPLCPYPRIARYLGQGSVEDAASFVCEN